jgi:hypothetical protein
MALLIDDGVGTGLKEVLNHLYVSRMDEKK